MKVARVFRLLTLEVPGDELDDEDEDPQVLAIEIASDVPLDDWRIDDTWVEMDGRG